MNRHAFLWAGFVTILFIVCTQTTLLATIFSLLVLGMIPGTNLTIPAWAMLVAYPILFLFSIVWLGTRSLFIGEQVTVAAPPSRNVIRKKATRQKTKTTTRRKNTAAKRRPRVAV